MRVSLLLLVVVVALSAAIGATAFTAGRVEYWMGDEVPGDVDANGENARFSYPELMAITSAGLTYVADSLNYKIRTVDLLANARTVTGSGSSGSADGTGVNATHNQPTGLLLNAAETSMYVSEFVSHKIRTISIPGYVVAFLVGSFGKLDTGDATTTGGVAGATDVGFDRPWGMAYAGGTSTDFYIFDYGNDAVRMCTAAGVVTTHAGSKGNTGSVDGTGTAAKFNGPTDGSYVAANSSFISVDKSGNYLRTITAPGAVVATYVGDGTSAVTDGVGRRAQIEKVSGIAVDPLGKYAYFPEQSADRVRKVCLTTATVTTVIHSSIYFQKMTSDSDPMSAGLASPKGVAFWNNTLYITQYHGISKCYDVSFGSASATSVIIAAVVSFLAFFF